jgi:hypothetical protein
MAAQDAADMRPNAFPVGMFSLPTIAIISAINS